jgi:hypothetical protein
MKPFLRALVLAGVIAGSFTGCSKKEPDVAPADEPALPPSEQLPTPSPTPGAPTGATPSDAPDDPQQNAAFEAWFKKHNLDLNDPRMLDADTDADGFSNRDEFLADSNPRDPNSRPGIHKTIRLKEYTEVKLPVILRSVEGDTAQIERLDEGGAKLEKVKTGQTVRGLPLKVEKIESRIDTDKHGERVDMSQLVLDDPTTKEKLVLVKDLPVKTSATSATLISADGKTTLTVKEGDTFTWPNEPGATFNVIDLREDQAVVKQVETGAMWTIPKQ